MFVLENVAFKQKCVEASFYREEDTGVEIPCVSIWEEEIYTYCFLEHTVKMSLTGKRKGHRQLEVQEFSNVTTASVP